ncbi:MAG TPA: hypothetical protein VIT90_18185 [Lysobacter sp.]
MFRRVSLSALLVLLAACQSQEGKAPVATIGGGGPSHPIVQYVCEDTKLAVQQLGESVSVGVNGAAPITLQQVSSTSDQVVYSNGRQSLTIKAGQTAWAMGRAAPVACAGG